MNNEVRELSVAQLDEVAGGMDCNVAIAVAKIYYSAGDILHSLGDEAGAHHLYGKGAGVMEGACDK